MTASDRSTPIFVRGMSRSGGTLVVTLLDAHPDVAMSYELYPTLLEPPEHDGGRDFVAGIARTLARAWTRRGAQSKLPTREVRTFVARCERSGLTHREVAQLLREHVEQDETFDTVAERLHFIARCAQLKMRKCGKTRWGLKCNNRYEQYRTEWPGAYFVDVLRDGRDVLASQLTTGSFNSTPEQVARSWVQTHRQFIALRERPDAKAYLVRYESLVSEPEDEVARLCAFLELPMADELLDFHRQSLTIYGARHLSMDRISKPIDSSQVGRWRSELNAEQIQQFDAVAGEFLREMNYSS